MAFAGRMSSSTLNPKLKAVVAERAGYCCEYCKSPADYCPDPFSVEHIHPRSQEGPADPENLAYSCQGCNGHKFVAITATDPISGEVVPLFHPRIHVWSGHFGWEDDSTIVRGLSAIGRASVERLKLNRETVVNLRRLLRTIGNYPRP